jgi:hypothetical protein
MNAPRQNRSDTAPWWLWPNLLGLDAPAVAVCWQALFARSFGIELPPAIHLVLALSAWCVYLADRLLDVFRTEPSDASTERHRFTRAHSGKLLVLLAVAAIADLALIVLFVPRNLVISGCVTALLLGVYYLIRLGFTGKVAAMIPREIQCGMLFALGCAIAPHAFAPADLPVIRYFLPVFFFGMLCSASCILISIWERDADLAANDRSFATSGSRLIPYVSTFMSGLALVAATLAFLATWQLFLAIALSALALRITLRFENRLPRPMLRALADGVLLTPLVVLVF